MMIFINSVYKENIFPRKYALNFLKLLNPVCPHITEELWERMGNKDTIAYEKWPEFDESKLVEDEKQIAVQVNGKVRGEITINTSLTEDEIKEKALNHENVKKHISGKEVVKVIVIKGKIINIVVK